MLEAVDNGSGIAKQMSSVGGAKRLVSMSKEIGGSDGVENVMEGCGGHTGLH